MITDAYKLSMALAGYPLREETFYFSFRKGGLTYIPLDLEKALHELAEEVYTAEVCAQLPAAYQPSQGMLKALKGDLKVVAAPKGSWVYEREPILSVTGPSFYVSLLEPMVLQLAYVLQVATAYKRDGVQQFTVSSAEMQERVSTLLSSLGSRAFTVNEDQESYLSSVAESAVKLRSVVDLDRCFEVGMRAALSTKDHMAALQVLKREGLQKTSNTLGPYLEEGLTLVGTMGHEHVQRFGRDIEAFRAMRDRVVMPPSFLLDTHDTVSKGIPAAVQAVRESNLQHYSIRYDSGNILTQFAFAESQFRQAGVPLPTHIIEDGLRPETVVEFEKMRALLRIPRNRVLYGFGGYFISHHWRDKNPYTRDSVSAVFKLSLSGGRPTMKFGNEAGLGKRSVPGKPVIWRRVRGLGPFGIIAQEGERVLENYVLLSGNPDALRTLSIVGADSAENFEYTLSPQTQTLVSQAAKER